MMKLIDTPHVAERFLLANCKSHNCNLTLVNDQIHHGTHRATRKDLDGIQEG